MTTRGALGVNGHNWERIMAISIRQRPTITEIRKEMTSNNDITLNGHGYVRMWIVWKE